MGGSLGGLIAAFPTPVTGSYESIATATGTGSSGTITFSSIPSGYTSLQIRFIARSDASGTFPQPILVNFNSDSASNYAWHYLAGDGATAYAGGVASTEGRVPSAMARAGLSANIIGAGIIDIQDYASTAKNTTVRSFCGLDANGSGEISISSFFWNNTAAVNSISLKTTIGNFTTATTFSLYGIKGA